MSPFTPKTWENTPSTDTPITAEALIDLEARLSNYSDTVAASILPFTRTGDLTVQAGTARFYLPTNITLMSVLASVATAPGLSGVLVDVNRNGTTVFTTQANRPLIPANGHSSSISVPNVTALTAGDYLTIDVDQIGTNTLINETFASTINNPPWTTHGTVGITSGQLDITPGAYPNYAGLSSTSNALALLGHTLTVEVPQIASHGTDVTVDTQMSFVTGSSWSQGAIPNSVSIVTEAGSIYFQYKIGTSSSNVGITYDSTAHRWWRIGESVNVITWSTSPDGTTWTERRTLATGSGPPNLDAGHLEISAGWYSGAGITPTHAILDNVTLTGPPGSGTGSDLTVAVRYRET